MVYKKITTVSIAIAIIATLVSNFVFAADFTSNDKIYDSVLDILIFIQKYSWPVVTIVFIYALYEFYLIGSEMLEHKFMGQRLIVGIAIFMAVVQCLPLIYAFITLAG
ncbi:MAG: hypothetical protein K0R72_523 [Clostridia bacterium]|jgi:hypothetical protein|nr:hypothetical protein [Clostridia bacterium]